MTTTTLVIGLLPLLLLSRVAVALGYGVRRFSLWFFEEPEGVVGIVARLLVVSAIAYGLGAR